ncbi:MAG TPA: ATP-binding protein [Gemmatimonadaceae bacterium]|nr:ATP-binding protein [Gemmatimonadaceae bacterium]
MSIRKPSLPPRLTPAALRLRIGDLGGSPTARPVWRRVLVAVALPVVATVITTALSPLVSRSETMLFLVAVAGSVWYGGKRAGALSTLLALGLVAVYVLEPVRTPGLARVSELIVLLLFAISAAIVISLNDLLHTTRERAAESARQALRLASELDEKATELETRVDETNLLTRALEEKSVLVAEGAQELEAARDDAELERGRMKRTLDALPDATVALDRDWRYTYLNPRAIAYLTDAGMRASDLLGRQVWSVESVLTDSEFERHARKAAREQRVVEYVQYRAQLGGYLETRVVPFENGVVVFARDVTQRIRTAEVQSLLAEAARVLAASLDYETTLRSVARLTVPSLGDLCIIDLIDDVGHLRRVHVQHGDGAGGARSADPIRRAVPDPTQARWRRHPIVATLRTGESTLLEGREVPASVGIVHEEGPAEPGLHALLSVPLTARGRVIGAITFALRDAGRAYDAHRISTAEEIARRAAIAIDNAQLYKAEQAARRATERSADRTRRLQRVTAALGEADSIVRIADIIITHGVEAAGADSALFAQLTENGASFETVRHVGYPAPLASTYQQFPVTSGRPMSDAVRTGSLIVVQSLEDAAARYPLELDAMHAVNAAASVSLPILVGDRAVACICLNFREPTTLRLEQRSLLSTIGQQCAQALERARLLQAERDARADAEAASRAKTEFLATMSHELRTPLNAIAGYTELIELGLRGPVTSEQLEDLQRIRRSQRYLLGLINDVLNFAKVESGHVHYDLRAVRLGDSLPGLEALIAPQLRDKGLEYHFEQANPDLIVRADRDKLEQIILNLLSNAVKFTNHGGRVTLSSDAQGDVIRIRVTDTGQGIPPDRLDAIFEPFVQVGRALTRTAEGTGLGLAISRDLARAMGGDLTADSKIDSGSSFTLELPAVHAPRQRPLADSQKS